MAILNYTTTIAPSKTVGEIQAILAKHGATNVMIDYAGGEPVAIAFTIPFQQDFLSFRLPSNAEGVYQALKKDPKAPNRYKTQEQARRVAWRITKDWVEAQLAIIEAGLASLPEVFFPYLLNAQGQTLFSVFSENNQKFLKGS